MIRRCEPADFQVIFDIINDAASVYQGVIPQDCWREPYMSREELRHEIDDGVEFWAYEEGGAVLGVMGLQKVLDVVLVRHAYVRTATRNHGIGAKLLARLYELTDKPVLIGTWADAVWAIRFYEKHGFRIVDETTKDRLLNRYWKISPRQVETSVVLADERWWNMQH
jgi:N-acetylglutamate synthase-like GNAT family acetyltransferase